MLIDIPVTVNGSSFSERSRSFLHNMYNIEGLAVPRERFRMIADYDSPDNTSALRYEGDAPGLGVRTRNELTRDTKARGLMVNARGDKMYAIIGANVYKIIEVGIPRHLDRIGYDFHELIGTLDQTTTSRISINGSPNSEISWAAGFTGIAFTTGTQQFFIDDDDVLTELFTNDQPFGTCEAVEYIDGRYLWLSLIDRIVYYSEVNDAGNVEPLSFFDSETSADETNEIAVIGNDLYVLGERSIERFRNVGPPTAPFVRVTNSVINVGYYSGIIKREESVIFIGREADGGFGIYRLGRGSIQKISNHFVDEMLNIGHAYGVERESVRQADGISFSSYGNNVFVFTIYNVDRARPLQTTFLDVVISAVSVYCMETPNGYQWGFISNAEVEGTFGGAPTEHFSEWERIGLNYLEYTHPVFFQGHWFFLRAPLSRIILSGISQGNADYRPERVGLYVMGNHRFDGNRLETISPFFSNGVDAESEVAAQYTDIHSNDDGDDQGVENITRGFITYLRDPLDTDIELQNLEIPFSKRWGFDEDGSEPTTDDVVNLSLSGDSGEFSQEFSQSFGDAGNRGRLRFQKSGGLLTASGFVGLKVETTSDNMIVFEKVLADV